MLLDVVGYAHPRVGLFESFLGDVLRATLSSAGSGLSEPPSAMLLERGSATLRDVRRLYASEPYRMPMESSLEDGGALMYGVGIDSSQLDDDDDDDGGAPPFLAPPPPPAPADAKWLSTVTLE